MRTLSTARLLVLAALAWTTTPVQLSPAHAAQTDVVLVTNQYLPGCAGKSEKLFTFDTNTRLLTNLGAPTVTDPTGQGRQLGEIAEAKPIDRNRKILTLWGGSGSQLPAIGIYDRTLNPPRWAKAFALSTAFELGGGKMPHSVEALPPDPNDPKEYFAVAQVGKIDGQGSGWIAVVDDTGAVRDKKALGSAHGVHFDAPRDNNLGAVFGVGWDRVTKFRYSIANKTLTWLQDYGLPLAPPGSSRPGGAAGGHDIRRHRLDDKFFVTADFQMWNFDPTATVKFTEILKNGASVSGVKSIDQRFTDWKTEYNIHGGSHAQFLGTHASVPYGDSCIRPYKGGRWLYAPGEKVWPEDVTTPPTGSWSPAIRVGPGANPWWLEVFTDADVTGVEVNIRDGERYVALTKQVWEGWTATSPVEVDRGDNMKIIVRRLSDSATAASITFPWLDNMNPTTELGWVCRFTPGSASSSSRVEVSIDGDVGATGYVEVRVGTGLWTQLVKQPNGNWAKDITVPSTAAVLIRAVRASDTAKAYSPVYQSWPPA